MWPFASKPKAEAIRKDKVSSEQGGKVLSVRQGSGRTRVAVEDSNGDVKYYFMTESQVRLGQKVRAGKVLGYVK